MYKKILVPLDGSWMAEEILPYARFFASGLNIPVELLQIIDPDNLQMHADVAPLLAPEPKDLPHRSVIGAYLERLASSFDYNTSVTRSIESGPPADVIVDKAAADPETLIAMCTHGHSGLQRWYLGSVTEKVLNGVKNHLLLVRRTENGGRVGRVALKTILVPLDGSTLAERILTSVASIGRRLQLDVVLVRVYDAPTSAYDTTEDYPPEIEAVTQQLENEVKSYLGKKARQLREGGVERVSSVAVKGKAADRIIDLARGTSEALVMMCTHGRSGIGRWVLGSVASRVVRHSNDPVLVVRATDG